MLLRGPVGVKTWGAHGHVQDRTAALPLATHLRCRAGGATLSQPMSSLDAQAASLARLSLFPRPQRMRAGSGRVRLPPRVRLEGAAFAYSEPPAVRWLAEACAARGHQLLIAPVDRAETLASTSELTIRVAAPAMSALPAEAGEGALQGYVLTVSEGEGIAILPGGEAGLQYALATLAQLIRNVDGASGQLALPSLTIEDWPDLVRRGAMLDISRDKVPTLATLKSLVERLARFKLNQLQLYMEHTFAYPGHERVWRDASPLSAEEVRELDEYCAARHVELVPNQNSFGHMQRWLVHPEYRALAECPEGFEHPWNWSGEPYGLCATDPASLRFLEGLYDALLPNFQSRLFNVGLDETIDLGAGRSRAACEARGTERVYLDFLREVHARVQARGRTMQFWGDILIKRPDLLAELPKDAIALEWGYEADHPFAEHLALFRGAGLPFYVCPGTSSWCSIAGRSENALLNLASAAREGKRAGASGYLITDWGDHGHLQPLAVSYLGFMAGAGFSWNVREADDPLSLDWPALLDRNVFCDSAGGLGHAAFELGNAYLYAGSLRPNASVLFWILIKPERMFSAPGVTEESLARTLAQLEQAGEGLERARPEPAVTGQADAEQQAENALVREELAWARDLLRFACRLGRAYCALAQLSADAATSIASAPAPLRSTLAQELKPLLARQRALWLARNRPGGLDDSARRLERILADLGT
jgi:hexosaminidase